MKLTQRSANAAPSIRYHSSTPRIALAAISMATVALTMGAMVVLPAQLEFASADGKTLTAACILAQHTP